MTTGPTQDDVSSADQAEGTTGRRPSRTVLAVAAVVVLGAVVAAVVLVRGGNDTVPYDDAASSGLLTLCDTKGHAVTGGKVTDKPLAPIVLGETPLDSSVPSGVQAIGTLYGYQPREGVEPLEFSGAPIGGPVAFARHAEPATRVVKDGYSLAAFTSIYPAQLDGYVQLRLITSADGYGAFTSSYDTADLKIDGDRWSVVRGGHASCADASSLLADR